MDEQLKELKELVRHNAKLVEETRDMVRGMRRSQRLRTVVSLVWWLVFLAASGAFYYYLLAPYTQQLLQIYNEAQHAIQSFRPGQ